MVAQQGLPGTGAHVPSPGRASAPPPADVADVKESTVTEAQAAEAEAQAAEAGHGAARQVPDEVPDPSPGGLPRWLVLVGGAAAATVAIAGVRSIAWLLGPVLLALVVVIALMPVQRFLQRHGWPRWASATVLLVLVWTILLAFVALLFVSIAQFAALLPDYADSAEALLASLVSALND